MSLRMATACVLLAAACMLQTACAKAEQQQKSSTGPVSMSAGDQGTTPDGKALFKQYCASCHPDGGNVSDPKRTLHGSALKSNKITTPEDIVRIMRSPLSRMIRFDPSTLSDRDARAIAEYILVTFK